MSKYRRKFPLQYVDPSYFIIGGIFMVVWLMVTPSAVEAGTYRSAQNEFEQAAVSSCSSPATHNVYGASWANNTGNQYSTVIEADPSSGQTVQASFYSSAYVCSYADPHPREEIKLVSISSPPGSRISFSGTTSYRADSAERQQFAGPHSTQPMNITIDISGLKPGRHSFSYQATYSDDQGVGASATRELVVDLEYGNRVSGRRMAGSGVTNTDVAGQNVSVRQPNSSPYNYQELDSTGESFDFRDIPPGVTRIAGSNTERYQMRYRYRICDNVAPVSSDDCDMEWTSWSSWEMDNTLFDINMDNGERALVRFEYQIPPHPDHGSASGTCDSFEGSINLDYEGSATVHFKAWLENDTEPDWQQTKPYGSAYGESRDYEFNIPNTYKDAYRDTNVRVRHTYDPRSDNDHNAFSGSIGKCGDYYEYEPSVDNITNPDDRGNRKPGQSFDVLTSVYNAGQDRSGTSRQGPDYEYTLQILSGGSYITTNDDLTLNRDGIWTDDTDHIPSRQFTIDDDAPHGTEVCFRVRVEPAEGQTWPSHGVRTVQETAYSDEEDEEACFFIYNLQFEVDNIWIDSLPDTVRQGETHTIEVNVQNAGDVNTPEPPINNAGTDGGTTNGILTTLDIWVKPAEGGTWTRADGDTSTLDVDYDTDRQVISYDYTVPNYDYDIIICPIAYTNPTAGWSDGSSWNPWSSESAPFDDTPNPVETGDPNNPGLDECDEMRVVDSPYFQVQRNDVHSGVSFAPTGNPILGCEQPDSGDRGFISAHRNSSENFGSLSEYAGYGTGDILEFGTAAVSASGSLSLESFFTSNPMNDRLTFANNPGNTSGQLGPNATRCIANLFGLLTQDESEENVEQLSGSVNLRPLFNPGQDNDDTQYYSSGNLEIRYPPVGSAARASNRRTTIIVDGDVTIEDDIAPNYNTYHGNNLTIIARNIYIDKEVERIDALLYAVPRDGEEGSGTSGIVDTCYEHDSLDTNTCDNQLVFYGAVFADRLDLKRTYGSLDPESNSPENDVDEPAEVFRYSPVHILRHPYFVFADDVPRPELPTQQLIDLPPRF